MMYLGYKILHLTAIAAVVAGLAGLAFHSVGGGKKEDAGHRALALATHGGGMLVLLITGFGMIARINASYGAVWVIAKILIWLAFGGLIALPLRSAGLGKLTWALAPILVAVAAFFALHKPGA